MASGGSGGTSASGGSGGTSANGGTGGSIASGGAGGSAMLGNGSTCSGNAECMSKHCVDGVCCESACAGSCEACAKTKSGGVDGVCTTVPFGTDPDSECPTATSCNGVDGCQGRHLWSARFGDASSDSARAIATDKNDNAFVTGMFGGSIDLGGGPLSCAGYNDIFVGKLSPSGKHQWSKHFGDANSQRARTVATDSNGNVVLAGSCEGSTDFGGGALVSAGKDDVCVAKLDSTGLHQWSKRYGDAASQLAYAITTDGAGNVIVAGELWGSIDFGGDLLTSKGQEDVFVAKLGPSGQHQWSKRFGEGGGQYLRSIATDGAGNVLLAGFFKGTIDFGGGLLTAVGDSSTFVAKLNPAGEHIWSNAYYNGGANGVTTDSSNNVLLAGVFMGGTDFGGGQLLSAGSIDVYVAKLSPSGQHVWSKRFGDSGKQDLEALAIDAAGNVVVAGPFEGSIDFGGGSLQSVGKNDIYVAKLNPNGSHRWSRSFGDTNQQHAYAVATDTTGNVLVTGDFDGSVDFGGGLLSSAGDDVFIAKLSW